MLSKQMETGSIYTVSGSSDTSSMRTPEPSMMNNNNGHSSSHRYRNKVKWDDESSVNTQESSNDSPMVSALSALRVNTTYNTTNINNKGNAAYHKNKVEIASRTKSEEATESNPLLKSKQNMRRGKESAFSAIRRVTNNIDTKKINQSARLRAMERHLAEMEKNGLLIDETTSSSTHDDLEVSDDSSDDEDENQNNSHKENRPVVAKPNEHSSVIAIKANNRKEENDVSDNVMINKSSVEERTTLSSTARNVNNLVKEGNATEHETEQDSYLFSPAAFAAAVTAIAATNVTDTATHTAITTNASVDKTDLTKPTTLDVSHNNNNYNSINNNNNNSINYNSNGDTNHVVDSDVNNDELECVKEISTCDITRPTTEESNNNVTSEQNESENTSDRASISFSHLKPQESLLNPNRVEESVRAIKKINEQMHADILKRKMEKEQSITEEEIEKVKHEVLREHRRNSKNRASTGNTNNSNYDIDYNSDNDDNDDDNDDNEHHTLHINPMRFSIKPNYIPVTPRDLRRMSSNSQLIHPHAHQEEILQHAEKTTLHNSSNMDQSEHTQDFSEANTIKNGNTIDNNNSGSSSNNHNSKSITKSNNNDAEDHNFSANLESSVNEALTYSSKECGNHTTISLNNDALTREVSTHTNALGPGKTNTKSETSKENDLTDIVAHKNSVEDKNTIDSNKHHEKKVKERLISVPNAGRNVFWFRPESAPYEMTESIAAKRRTLPERTNTQMETRTSLHSGRITQGSVHRPESIGRASMNIPVHAAHNITKSDGNHDNNINNSYTSSNNMNSDNDKKKEKKKSISAKTEEGSVENAKVNMFTSQFERQSSTLSTPTAKSSRRSSGLIRRTSESGSFIEDKEKFVTERRQSLQSVNGRLLSRCSSVSSLSMTSRQELSLQKHYTRLNSSRSQLSDMISSVSSDSSYAANKPATRNRCHNNSNSNINSNNNNDIKRNTREIGKGALATATQKANRENEVHGNEDANNTNSNVAASSSITPVSTPEKNGINDKTRNVRNESSIPPLPRSPSKKMLVTATPLKNDATIVEISTLEDHDVMRKSKARLSVVAPEQLVDNEISSVDVTPYSIATPSQLNSANQSAGKVDVSVIRQQLINSLKTEQPPLVNAETPLRRLNEEQEFQKGESVAVADNNNNNNNKNNDNNGSNTRINDSILSSSDKTNDNNNHTSSNNNIGSSHNRSDLLYKKELMVSVLQGLAQQTRHVLPCYLCGDMQHIVSYKHHIAVCRPRTLALLDEYEQTHGSEENPASANENNTTEKELTNNESTAIADRQLFYDNEKRRAAIEAVEELYIPTQKSSYEEKTRFSHACLHCASALLVQCKKCKMLLRIEDVRQHECQCGLSYYSSSKNCHRIRAAAERIVNSLSEIEQSDVIAN